MTLPDSKTLTLDGRHVVYLDGGETDGGTVLLLHGGGLDCATLSWRYLLPELARTHRVIAPNWPGYGGSAGFGRDYTIADLGRWLAGLMETLDVAKADMVGVSMGGGATLWTAVHHPGRVGRLVPVGSYGLQARGPYHLLSYLVTKLPLNAASYALLRRSHALTRRALAAILADPGKVTDQIVDEVMSVLNGPADPLAFSQFQRGEMTADGLRTVLMPQVDQITHPTLFVHGKDDTLVPLADIQDAAKRMPNAQLVVMDAGHWPMREQPEAFNEAVTAFLR